MTESNNGIGKKIGIGSIIAYSVCFSVLILILGFLQICGIRIAGQIPALVLAAVSAIGFISGEKFGAIFGIIGGVLIAYLGKSGITLDPVLYMLCGYFCGVLFTFQIHTSKILS